MLRRMEERIRDLLSAGAKFLSYGGRITIHNHADLPWQRREIRLFNPKRRSEEQDSDDNNDRERDGA